MHTPLSLVAGTGACFVALLLAVGPAAAAPPANAIPAATVGPAPAASATPKPTPPPGPLLKPVPDATRWTLTTTRKRPEAAAAPGASPGQSPEAAAPGQKDKSKDPATTTVGERLGKLAHLLVIRASGGKDEKWTDGKLTAFLTSEIKAPLYSTESIERMPLPGWINRDNYTETRKQGEKGYLIFKTRILPTGAEVVRDMEAESQGKAQDLESLKVDALAVVDDDTRLPVVVKEGETTMTYKFEPLAPDAQIIPPEIQASLAEKEKKMQDSIHKPVHP